MPRYKFLSIVVMVVLALTGVVQAQQITNITAFVLDVRADLETVATEALGGSTRPESWTFDINNTSSPTYVADLWYDNELLATAVFGNERPDGWIGAPVTKDINIVARNIRHDLELIADKVYGLNNRPENWKGSISLFKCDRTIMNTVEVLRTTFNVKLQTANDAVNYCQQVAGENQEQVLKQIYSTPEVEQALPDKLLAARGDLERLADEELGLNTRPAGWIGNKDKGSATLLSDNFLDLENLANEKLGIGQRPVGWLGTPPAVAVYGYQYLRFNLELLANAVGRTPRPRGWQGIDQTESCAPQLQNLVALAQRAYGFSTDTVPPGNFCQQLDITVNNTIENPPPPDTTEASDKYVFEGKYAFTYLDVKATQYMGIMPGGTKFKAWYRNFGDSTMMFVSGQDFAVFVDRRWTSMPQDVFEKLPTLEGVKPLTFCDAGWCNGPGPTPTPTGGGALQALLNQGTPPAPPDINQVQNQKTQVSWNNIRVTYLQDNSAARTAQVTLEICAETTQTDCEPVTRVYDNATGTAKPVISTQNGLNVYEFGYGYTNNLLIEGETRFSPDVWISDPTIR
ncbi:MAG: hypothetical protein GC179_06210 [Anaerolineaceae bacterium]|nr:hypothetical protein [Anaerolineaceae bacterium]